MRFSKDRYIHLVGIGGFGISAIARILLEQGYRVSGSDLNSNALTEALVRDGAAVYQGHDGRFVEDADIVIISSAVTPDHVEVAAAREKGIPVYKRNEIIADLMEGQFVIAIAGTHGKTTTTAMVTHILRECGKDPSYIVGGIMGNMGTNAGVGKGDIFVIEADEYDNMFLGLKPDIAVITSIEYDHPDFFKTESQLIEAFRQFAYRVPKVGGVVSVCYESELARELAGEMKQQGYNAGTYGFDNGANYYIDDLRISEDGSTSFDVLADWDEHGLYDVAQRHASVMLPLAGRHNALNALAAMLAAMSVGVALQDAADALATFKSTGRRFDLRGEAAGVVVIDDYAHHPTAIKVTIEAARMRYPDHHIWAVWQPHTFSRTQTLLEGYAHAFADADAVVVTDIYASREKPTVESITGQQTAGAIHHARVFYTGSLQSTADFLEENVRAPAVILIMSAGDAPQIGEDYLERLQTRPV